MDEDPVETKPIKLEPFQPTPPGTQGGDDMDEDPVPVPEVPVDITEPMNIDNPLVTPPEDVFYDPILQGPPEPTPAQPQPPTVSRQFNAAADVVAMDIPSVN